jgi:hypothetical protein
MSEQLSQALKNLRDVLQQEVHEQCTSVTVVFNCEGHTIVYNTRTPASLKHDGIRMRNLCGEWVK